MLLSGVYVQSIRSSLWTRLKRFRETARKTHYTGEASTDKVVRWHTRVATRIISGVTPEIDRVWASWTGPMVQLIY